MTDREFSRLVERLYAAALDADALSDVAATLARALGAPSGFIAFIETRPAEADVPRVWTRPAAAGAPSPAARDDGVRRQLERYHVLGARIPIEGTVAATFGAERPQPARRFDDAERRLLVRTLPHLQRTLRIRFRLGLAELHRMFPLASLAAADARLELADRVRHAAFARRVADAASATSGRERASDGTLAGLGAPALSAAVSPLAAATLDIPQHAAVVMLRKPAARVAANVDALAQRARLTPAERRVLAAIVAGESPAAYAERSGISPGTARLHLKRVFEKTGYHRQSELVRAVLE